MPTLTQARRSAKLQRHTVVKVTNWAGEIDYQSRAYPWENSFLGYSEEGSIDVIEDYRTAPLALNFDIVKRV
jgi:hypothetical protein